MDFPVGSQCRRSDRFVADQLVCALLSHLYCPFRANAQGTLYCPSRRCGTELLDDHSVAQKAGKIPEIPIESEDVLDGASDRDAGFNRIFVSPQW